MTNNCTTGFKSTFDKLISDKGKFNEYPLFKYLFHLQENKGNPKPNGTKDYEKRNYQNLSDNDRTAMKVDEIFAFYLYNVAQKVNENFYTETMLPYVILFRECLDEIGWQKKAESENQNAGDGETK